MTDSVSVTAAPSAARSKSGGGGGGDDGWSTITDDRKIAYEKRKAKKIAEAKAELLAKTDLHSDDAVAAALLKADRMAAQFNGSGSQPFSIERGSGKGPAQTKKKKTGNSKLQITSENQLIEVVIGLVRNVPNNRPIQVSAIGDKLTVRVRCDTMRYDLLLSAYCIGMQGMEASCGVVCSL